MNISTFLVSVGAGIVCHYFCKWLDGVLSEKDN